MSRPTPQSSAFSGKSMQETADKLFGSRSLQWTNQSWGPWAAAWFPYNGSRLICITWHGSSQHTLKWTVRIRSKKLSNSAFCIANDIEKLEQRYLPRVQYDLHLGGPHAWSTMIKIAYGQDHDHSWKAVNQDITVTWWWWCSKVNARNCISNEPSCEKSTAWKTDTLRLMSWTRTAHGNLGQNVPDMHRLLLDSRAFSLVLCGHALLLLSYMLQMHVFLTVLPWASNINVESSFNFR